MSKRPDVLSFETPVLKKDLEVNGSIKVSLYVSTDCVDTDFTAKLMDVYPGIIWLQLYLFAQNHLFLLCAKDNKLAINISDSIVRGSYHKQLDKRELLEPNKVYLMEFFLYPTCNLFAKGHKLRVDISSSNFPRFDVNPNTAAPLWSSSGFLFENTSY